MCNYFVFYPTKDKEDGITFRANTDFNLVDFNGLASTQVTPLTKKIPFRKGVKYLNNNVDMRNIVINLRLNKNSIAEINELIEELYLKLDKDVDFHKIGELGILEYHRAGEETLEINVTPIESPSLSYVTIRGNVVDVDIEFLAPNPYFKKTEEVEFDFEMVNIPALFEDTLEFPLEFVSGNVTEIFDIDTDIPIPFLLQVYGYVDGFSIINNTTGEILNLDALILEDEYIEIYTGYGEKRVEIVNVNTGERRNAINTVTLIYRDFWKFIEGLNDVDLLFDTIDGGSAVIYYTGLKAGV